MNAEIAKEWVEALRSGKYEQGQENLCVVTHQGDQELRAHCCLGVLCELAVAAGVVGALPQFDGPAKTRGCIYYGSTDGRDADYLPAEVMNWASMATYTGDFCDEQGEERSLAELNDNGATFSAIADIIEQRVAEL